MLRVGLGAALSFLQNESGVRIPAVKAMNHRGGFSSIPRRWSGVVNYELEELHAKKPLAPATSPPAPFRRHLWLTARATILFHMKRDAGCMSPDVLDVDSSEDTPKEWYAGLPDALPTPSQESDYKRQKTVMKKSKRSSRTAHTGITKLV